MRNNWEKEKKEKTKSKSWDKIPKYFNIFKIL